MTFASTSASRYVGQDDSLFDLPRRLLPFLPPSRSTEQRDAGNVDSQAGLCSDTVRLLVIGQTPPPHHGQALMTEQLVRARSRILTILHIRTEFSGVIANVGRPSLRKVLHLLRVLSAVVRVRLTERVDVVLYSPAGPSLTPVLKDCVLLGLVRLLYRRVVLHFHAAGLSEFLERQSPPVRALARLAYAAPAGAIQTSALNPPDAIYVRARDWTVIANGVPDVGPPNVRIIRPLGEAIRLLFVGTVSESKGVRVLLESAALLRDAGVRFALTVVGAFESVAFQRFAAEYCLRNNLNAAVTFTGPLVGSAKWHEYHKADIFCFPSFYECESFGNVVIEAMMCRLAVVATRWRGIADVVDDGITGILVPTRDARSLCSAIHTLALDPALRFRMAENGRAKYVREYTAEAHLSHMERYILHIAGT